MKCANVRTISFSEENRVRTMTFGFGFCSVLYGVGFGFLHIVLLSGSGSVVGKTWVLVRFVVAWFRFFPISNRWYCRCCWRVQLYWITGRYCCWPRRSAETGSRWERRSECPTRRLTRSKRAPTRRPTRARSRCCGLGARRRPSKTRKPSSRHCGRRCSRSTRHNWWTN